MEIKVQKWGNSLAIRIPKSFAKETKINDGSVIDLSITSDGKLIAQPIKKEYSLVELMKKVTSENIHDEIDTGNAIGEEIW